jgi:streptogramin lyase
MPAQLLPWRPAATRVSWAGALVIILTTRLAFAASFQVINLAGTGIPGDRGDGGPAIEAQLNNPYGIVLGPDGSLYICDMGNHKIRRVQDGRITTLAGTGKRGYRGDGGPARQAELSEPYEIRLDTQGNIYFVEMQNHLLRRIDAATQRISTVAGTGERGFSGDGGPAGNARLNQPHSLQLDAAGNLFICDIGNHRIRRIIGRTGQIETFAGTGQRGVATDGAAYAQAPLNGPRALDFDRDGNLWLALREGNAVFRLDTMAGTLHHVAGTGAQGFSGHGAPAKTATLSGPKGISIAPDGNVYLADTESHSVRMIDVQRGTIELIAGTGEKGDGPEGNPLTCKLSRPHGVFAAAQGTVFIGDSEAHRVRVIRRRN